MSHYNIGRLTVQLIKPPAPRGVSDYGIRSVGFPDEPGQIQLTWTYARDPLSQLPELMRQHVIDDTIFSVDSWRLGEMAEIFLLCDEEGVRTRVVVPPARQ